MTFSETNQLAFAAHPICLSSSTSATSSSFHGASCHRLMKPANLNVYRKKRNNRARIFSLGAAPPPPSPESDDDDDSKTDEGGKEEDIKEVEQPKEITADDILNSPTFLKKKLEILQKEIIEVKEKNEQNEDNLSEEKQRYVRLAADFENYRRRSMEDLRESESKSVAKVCKEILSVLDNFERAKNAVTPATDNEIAIFNSFQSINKQLLDSLIKLNVEPIDSVGQAFDPEVHEAIQRLDSNEHPEDVVCQQYSRGYKINETLIRAAVVGVSAGPGPAGETPVPSNDGEETVGEDPAQVEAKEEAPQAADGL